MEIIRSYVESAFAAYASTSRMQDLKEEILFNMEEKYEELKAHGHSDNETLSKHVLCRETLRTELQLRQRAFRPKFAAGIGVGVVLCILSVIPPAVMNDEFGFSAFVSEQLAPALLLAMVSVGVFLLVSFGVRADSYQKLLRTKDAGQYGAYDMEKEEDGEPITRSSPVLDIVFSIYWCLIIAAYLLWSFGTNDWGRSWIIWPAAGVLFGGIAGAVKLIERNGIQ